MEEQFTYEGLYHLLEGRRDPAAEGLLYHLSV